MARVKLKGEGEGEVEGDGESDGGVDGVDEGEGEDGAKTHPGRSRERST